MNIKLNEWNKLVEYGNKLCNDLKDKGYNVTLKPYTMYDGRKGLYMQVFDSFGKLFTQYASGVGTFEEIKKMMLINKNRILAEC